MKDPIQAEIDLKLQALMGKLSFIIRIFIIELAIYTPLFVLVGNNWLAGWNLTAVGILVFSCATYYTIEEDKLLNEFGGIGV